ncbi:hypothetical protein DL96DRAFT_1717124 [Flagelloscypha sp. PMI_526]|nr:hypothetical protein DL96DRAFT_1717124 [Flagelloscypha sp. PMI_526]
MSDAFVSGCLQLSALVVLYWDHILMLLPLEMASTQRSGTVLPQPVSDVLGKHSGLLLYIFGRQSDEVPKTNYPSYRCGIFKKYHQALIIVPQVIVTGTVIAGWSISTSPDVNEDSEGGCPQPGLSDEVAIRRAIPWEMLFAYDLVAFILTVARRYQGMNESGGVEMRTHPPIERDD